jgi:hypothetical protein
MVLDGSCGHRPMIRRPSDMVSVVDRWVDGCFCCEFVREKVRYLVRSLTKNSVLAQLTFFNSSLRDVDVSLVNDYKYLICRAWSALSKTVLILI